ncbi:UTP--glucose-1-phosphate uridylyltransferase [Paraperlucidibaca baekdonensis]|uniref:UTP--glucose-1-phosphate uridylyltransferase n=1 Tax=Paraperlucidibaca baekdonensis TaxID=748120 RepID=A0A3E0H6N2_9GAMM|nr:UTP--glucose-1-phosphate uridylyltransferase [Paraperlucidibaca baekdonensis]REH38868.1 UTP--glucose-1-phosphate uridylyltransferase [Paraperlucidibaca baekdonensis]
MISTVILPVAGLGTRFLPATKSVPKELLPVVDKPLLQYAVEEACRAGIRHVVLVNSPKKSGLETHLQPADPELVAELTAKGKKDLLAALLGTVPEGLKVTVAMQPQALGLGHAVACGAEAAMASAGDGVAVMLVDDFIDAPLSGAGAAGCLADMVALHEATGAWSLAVEEVPRDQVHRYGVVSLAGEKRISAMVEKPAADVAPSNLAVVGRYVLPKAIFAALADVKPGAGGEIQLTDGISALLAEHDIRAHRFAGVRYDCGSKLGYAQANMALALRDPELAAPLRAWLQAELATPAADYVVMAADGEREQAAKAWVDGQGNDAT